MTETFAYLATIYDHNWQITAWKGDVRGETQTVTIELKRKGKSASDVYREGVLGHSHANWMVEGDYIDEPVL